MTLMGRLTKKCLEGNLFCHSFAFILAILELHTNTQGSQGRVVFTTEI